MQVLLVLKALAHQVVLVHAQCLRQQAAFSIGRSRDQLVGREQQLAFRLWRSQSRKASCYALAREAKNG